MAAIQGIPLNTPDTDLGWDRLEGTATPSPQECVRTGDNRRVIIEIPKEKPDSRVMSHRDKSRKQFVSCKLMDTYADVMRAVSA